MCIWCGPMWTGERQSAHTHIVHTYSWDHSKFMLWILANFVTDFSSSIGTDWILWVSIVQSSSSHQLSTIIAVLSDPILISIFVFSKFLSQDLMLRLLEVHAPSSMASYFSVTFTTRTNFFSLRAAFDTHINAFNYSTENRTHSRIFLCVNDSTHTHAHANNDECVRNGSCASVANYNTT